MATNPTAYQAMYSREYNKKKRELGLCLKCKEPAKSKSLCELHLKKKNELAQKTRAARRKAGVCVYCGVSRPCKCKGRIRSKYSQLKISAKKRNIEMAMSKKEFEEWMSRTPKNATTAISTSQS